MKKHLILFSFLFILVVSSFVFAEEAQQEITLIKTQQNMQQAIDENARTVTYTFSSSDSAIEVQRKIYWSVVPASENNKAYVKTDDKGNLIEADLTASQSTTWTFGQETLKVPEGARVVFKDGKLEIIGKENQEVGLTDKNSGNEIKNNLKLGKESVSIENGVISGKNFWVGSTYFEGTNGHLGSVSLVKEGIVLNKETIARRWNGLDIYNENQDRVLLSNLNSPSGYNNYLYQSGDIIGKRLVARGEGFFIRFNPDSSLLNIDNSDNFAIKMIKDCGVDIRERFAEGKIPEVLVSGQFRIYENAKALSSDESGKLMITRYATPINPIYQEMSNVLMPNIPFNQKTNSEIVAGLLKTTTSPVEVIVNGVKEKFIVNDQKGVAILPFNEVEGRTDERYANSLYFKRASTELRYDQPTLEDVNQLMGGDGIWYGVRLDPNDPNKDRINNPANMRFFRDMYLNMPVDQRSKLQGPITFVSPEYFELVKKSVEATNAYAFFLPNPLEENFPQGIYMSAYSGGKYISDSDVVVFTHEVGHAIDQFGEFTSIGGKSLDIKPTWINIAGGVGYYQTTLTTSYNKQGFLNWAVGGGSGPQGGFVSPYGATNPKEDIATFREKVLGDPAFFKRNNLIGENADTRYAQKLELLKNYGLITPQEYDAVMHPEKYEL